MGNILFVGMLDQVPWIQFHVAVIFIQYDEIICRKNLKCPHGSPLLSALKDADGKSSAANNFFVF